MDTTAAPTTNIWDTINSGIANISGTIQSAYGAQAAVQQAQADAKAQQAYNQPIYTQLKTGNLSNPVMIGLGLLVGVVALKMMRR
jgi:hypothetical protein